MSPQEALAFVERHWIVLEAARGPVPSLAETIGGGPIRGGWWGHPMGHEIFAATEAIADNEDVLVCKLIDGKVTYVHRRLWPALVKVADRFVKGPLARVWNEHTPSGSHRMRRTEFPEWVPAEVMAAAAALSVEEAEKAVAVLLRYGRKKTAPVAPRSRTPHPAARDPRRPDRGAPRTRGTGKK